MTHFELRTWISLVGLLGVAAWTACGEDAAPSLTTQTSDDTASAYEALSASLQACEEQEDACTTAAAGNPAQVMNCQTQAAACKQKTDAAAEHARENLSRDTHACWKRSRHGDDDAGAVMSDDDAGTGDMHGCIEKHTPRLPKCVAGFLGCLREAGSSRKREVTRDELGACIDQADQCFRDAFAERRGQTTHHGNKAGSSSAVAGTGAVSPAAAGSGGSAGSRSSGAWDRGQRDRNRGRR